MEYGAPAAIAVRVDEVGDRRVEAGLPQRFDDQIALPRAIMRRSSQCCTAQPPHTPKCGQIGAMRSALARFDAQKLAPVGMTGDRFDLDRFARQAYRAQRSRRPAPSATPSPRWPSRAIVSRSTTLGLDEKFAIAVAAEDRRRHDAADAPAVRGQKRGDIVADGGVDRRIAHDAFLDVAARRLRIAA